VLRTPRSNSNKGKASVAVNRVCVLGRFYRSLIVVSLAALTVSAAASAEAYLSPPVVKAKDRQVFTLAVQSEKQGERIPVSVVELFVPDGFSIDSFAPTAGWEQDWTIQSVQKATWSRDEEDLTKEKDEASEQDAVFQFFGRPGSSREYTFTVRQTYADGSVVQRGPKVDWPGGPKSSAGVGPAVVAKSSFDGATSTLAIVALIVGALGLVVGIAALLFRGGKLTLRP
jgi:uncharacterized protein YcnI